MTSLVWDVIGERFYQSGLDRGVLYLRDGTAVPWNGLTGVEETTSGELQFYYLEGVKYLQNLTPGDFQAKLKAFTYPEEFESVSGIAIISPGLAAYEQPSKSFNLTYRTLIGNDLDGTDYGYKIHILYNVLAVPDEFAYDTADEAGFQPIEFSWTLSATPEKLPGYRPTAHLVVDSNKTPPKVLRKLELKLYGSRWENPVVPPISDIVELYIPPVSP